ncbi:MAG: acyltransferase [Solirubrobacterales bacterium]
MFPAADKRRALLARVRAELLRRSAAGRNLRLGEGPLFYDAMPRIDASGEIRAGDGFSIYSQPVRAQVSAAPGARIAMGDGVGINFGADLFAARTIEVGDATMIGPMVVITDTNFHPIDEGEATKTEPVRIGSNVWLGRGAMILPGVEIGDHAVIAAGAVVARDVPPRTVAAGNPARPLREVTAADGWRRNREIGVAPPG